jgi:hypothetical protein
MTAPAVKLQVNLQITIRRVHHHLQGVGDEQTPLSTQPVSQGAEHRT